MLLHVVYLCAMPTTAPPPPPPASAAAMSSISEKNIFHRRPVLRNFNTKRSAFIVDSQGRHLLCLAGIDNVLVLHVLDDNTSNAPNLKTIYWFHNAARCIQDICFDPSGSMLLILCKCFCYDGRFERCVGGTSFVRACVCVCYVFILFGNCFCFCCADILLYFYPTARLGYDNTLHTVPVCWVLDRNKPSNESFPLASEQITSFIVPFAGPHECPNSKTCPNNAGTGDDASLASTNGGGRDRLSSADSVVAGPAAAAVDTFSALDINELVASDGLYNTFFFKSNTDNNNVIEEASSTTTTTVPSVGADGQHINGTVGNCDCADDVNDAEPQMVESKDVENPCPYPCCVVWWRTLDARNCAIIGYSDGSICIVGK